MKYHMLVVDDESIVRKGLETYDWAPFGFEVVHSCGNGREALLWMQSHPVDLVLTDIKMPGIDGIELSDKIKDMFPEVLVILLSGFSEFSYAQKGIRNGVFDYLLKPVEDEELEHVFRNAYNKIKEQSEKQRSHKDLLWNMWLRMQVHNCAEADEFMKSLSAQIQLQDEEAYYITDIFLRSYSDLDMPAWHAFTKKWRMVQLGRTEWVGLIPADGTHKMKESLRSFPAHSGFSEMKTGTGEVAQAYLEANHAVQRAFIYPDQHIFEYPSEEYAAAKELPSLFKQLYILALKANALNPAEMEKELHEFLDIFIRQETPTAQIKQLLQYFISGMESVLSEKSLFPFAEWMNEQADLFELIEQASSLAVIREKVIPGIGRIIEGVKTLNESYSLSGRIVKILDYIHEHYQEQLSLDDIAERFGMHPSLFSKYFKEQRGINYIDYLTRYRLQRAKQLMERQNIKISEIAMNVGYCDLRYFGQVFKKYTGLKPTEYRAMFHH